MKARNLAILVVLAVILAGLAYISSLRKSGITSASAVVGKHVLPNLQEADALNNIEKVVFQSAESTVTVARVDGVWVAPGKYNYPVDFGKVRDFVQKVADLKIGQPVTLDERQLEKLDLVSPESGQTNKTEHMGSLIKFKDKADGVIAAMVVGKEHMKKAPTDSSFARRYRGYPDGRYVAVGGNVFLVTETFRDIPDNDKEWFDDDLVNVASSDVIEIAVTDPEGKSLTLKRSEDGVDLALDKLSKREEMDTSKVSGLANVLSYLTFADVADPGLPDKDTGLDKPIIYVVKTKKGEIYTLKIGGSPEESSDRYLRLSAVFEPPPETLPSANGDRQGGKDKDVGEEKAGDEEAGKKAEEETRKKKEEQEKLAKEVREFNEKHEKWTYLIQSYKIDKVTTDRTAFIKKEEVKKDKEKKDEVKKEGSFLKKLLPWKKDKNGD